MFFLWPCACVWPSFHEHVCLVSSACVNPCLDVVSTRAHTMGEWVKDRWVSYWGNSSYIYLLNSHFLELKSAINLKQEKSTLFLSVDRHIPSVDRFNQSCSGRNFNSSVCVHLSTDRLLLSTDTPILLIFQILLHTFQEKCSLIDLKVNLGLFVCNITLHIHFMSKSLTKSKCCLMQHLIEVFLDHFEHNEQTKWFLNISFE